MSVRPWRDIQRKKTRKISVGDVEIGGDAPISVQSMTNTITSDFNSTIKQINELDISSCFFNLFNLFYSFFNVFS